MARKPTPAGNTADTTPPAAAAASVAAPAPADAPAASLPANAPATDTSAAASATPPAAAAADVPEGASRETPTGDPNSAPGSDDDTDAAVILDARVLLAFDEHQPDDIVSGTLDALAVLERDGKVDTHPDAVAYARSLKA